MATGTQVDSGCFSGCCTNTKFVKTRATKEYELADAIARFDPETVSKALNKVIKYGARNRRLYVGLLLLTSIYIKN